MVAFSSQQGGLTMERNDLLKWKEFGVDNAPSIKSLFSKNPYPNQNEIANYLENGETTLVATSYEQDLVTGEKIHPLRTKCIKTNDGFSWDGSLPYYVRKYNLRLPIAFEEKILNIIAG